MPKQKFQIGDKVRIVRVPPINFAPGIRDELGTEKLFRSMIGKFYTVRGFDKYGHVELEPRRFNTVWIEPEFLRLRARRKTRRHRSH